MNDSNVKSKLKYLEGQSVPTFIINDRYKIVGAQPYNVFQETLQKIVAENNR